MNLMRGGWPFRRRGPHGSSAVAPSCLIQRPHPSPLSFGNTSIVAVTITGLHLFNLFCRFPPTMPQLADTAPANISETGAVPSRRIGKAEHLIAAHDKQVQEDSDNASMRAIAQALIDGEPPYDQSALDEQGLGDNTNLDFGEAKAMVEQSMAPYIELIDSVPMVAEVALDLEDSNEAIEKSHVASTYFDAFLKSWTDFHSNIHRLSYHNILSSVAFAYFPDERTPFWEPASLGEFYLDRLTPLSDTKIDVATVQQLITVSDLYAKVRDATAAGRVGWNVAAVKKAIFNAQELGEDASFSQYWEEFQTKFKEGDYHLGMTSKKVRLIYGMVKEFNGKITLSIASPSNPDTFLCDRPNAYDHPNQCYVMFRTGVGSGTVHSSRGLAYAIHNTCQVSNRILCEGVDSVLAEGRQVFAAEPEAIEEFRHVRLGPYLMIDKRIEPVQMFTNGAAQRILPMWQTMAQIRANNTGGYASRNIAGSEGDNPSATQVRAEVIKENTLNSAQMTLFYEPYSKVLFQQFKRAVSGNLTKYDAGYAEAKEFIKACEKKGVTIEELRKVKTVKAIRSIGNGSAQAGNLIGQELIAMSSGFDETGKKYIIHDVVARRAGQDAANRYVPLAGPRKTLDFDIATLENANFRNGVPVPVNPDQNHASHLEAHFPLVETLVMAVQQQQVSQEQAVQMLRPAMDNITQHVLLFSENALRQVEAGEMRKRLQNVAAFVDQLSQQMQQKMLKQQREAQAAAGDSPTPEQQFELQKLDRELMIEQQKQRNAQEAHQQAMEKGRQSMLIADAKGAVDIANKTAKPAGRPPLL